MGTIRIGVSGWSYDDWSGPFYPDDLPASRRLAHIGDRFPTVEVNGTFYSLTSPEACRSWYEATPPDFVFSIKGSRFITHGKKLADVDGALANFFASGILELDDKLGPILWQLPGTLRFDAGRVDSFLSLLPSETEAARTLARRHDDRVERPSLGPDVDHRVRHVLEVRDRSFLVPGLVRILRRHGVALAFSHASGWPYTEEVTAGFVYLRLHGPDEAYGSPYGRDRLDRWADRIVAWHGAAEPDDPERITHRKPPARRERDVYVYFDNDRGAHAPRDAVLLAGLVSERLEG